MWLEQNEKGRVVMRQNQKTAGGWIREGFIHLGFHSELYRKPLPIHMPARMILSKPKHLSHIMMLK